MLALCMDFAPRTLLMRTQSERHGPLGLGVVRESKGAKIGNPHVTSALPLFCAPDEAPAFSYRLIPRGERTSELGERER